jgi:hypothetical protein
MPEIDMTKVMAAVSRYGPHFKPIKREKSKKVPVDASRRKVFRYSETHPMSPPPTFARFNAN